MCPLPPRGRLPAAVSHLALTLAFTADRQLTPNLSLSLSFSRDLAHPFTALSTSCRLLLLLLQLFALKGGFRGYWHILTVLFLHFFISLFICLFSHELQLILLYIHISKASTFFSSFLTDIHSSFSSSSCELVFFAADVAKMLR